MGYNSVSKVRALVEIEFIIWRAATFREGRTGALDIEHRVKMDNIVSQFDSKAGSIQKMIHVSLALRKIIFMRNSL